MEQLNRAQVNGPNKRITIGRDGKKKYPEGTIFTKLKFKKSEKSGLLVGFVSQNPANGRIRGVREDSEYPKQVCVVDSSIAPEIMVGTLYDAAIVPMYHKKGFIVIEALLHQFPAEIEVCYIPKACYVVRVKFGNKTIVFDPKDGSRENTRSLKAVKAMLDRRNDILHPELVMADFLEAAEDILKKFEHDGFYVKKGA